MRSAGIRDLKAHLSRYLKEVKRGAEIEVSERGKAIARIVPVAVPEEEERGLRALLHGLSTAGRVILPVAYKPPAAPKFRKKAAGEPFSRAVLEGRR